MWKNRVGNFVTPDGRASGDFYIFLWGEIEKKLLVKPGKTFRGLLKTFHAPVRLF
jgi:hypothetical protein